jgi:hypothetical protein
MVKAFRFAAVGAASGIAAQSLAAPAKAGNGFVVGAGLAGFGIGAILGSAPAPREVYVVLPPPPIYCGPVPYGPPPLTPGWYDYCARRYPGFSPQAGYSMGPDGQAYFCR